MHGKGEEEDEGQVRQVRQVGDRGGPITGTGNTRGQEAGSDVQYVSKRKGARHFHNVFAPPARVLLLLRVTYYFLLYLLGTILLIV